jgi:hypothetical protein
MACSDISADASLIAGGIGFLLRRASREKR